MMCGKWRVQLTVRYAPGGKEVRVVNANMKRIRRAMRYKRKEMAMTSIIIAPTSSPTNSGILVDLLFSMYVKAKTGMIAMARRRVPGDTIMTTAHTPQSFLWLTDEKV